MPNGGCFVSWRSLQVNLPPRKKVLCEKDEKVVTKLCE